LKALFERCGLTDLARAGRSIIDVYDTTLDEGSAELGRLLDGLRELGLTWGVTRGPIFKTLLGEILVTERLRAALLAIEPLGLELREAVDRSGSRLGMFQLLAGALPPMHPSTEGFARDDVCGSCSRNGYFNSLEEPERIRYAHDALPSDPADAYSTFELFGYTIIGDPFTESRLPQPLLLVSPRVYDVFRDLRVPNATFGSVEFVDG
jgi:hypothetical protein